MTAFVAGTTSLVAAMAAFLMFSTTEGVRVFIVPLCVGAAVFGALACVRLMLLEERDGK